MDIAPCVRLPSLAGHEAKKNDVIFCGTEAQQHVVFFPGDVQVSRIKLTCSVDLITLFFCVICLVRVT